MCIYIYVYQIVGLRNVEVQGCRLQTKGCNVGGFEAASLESGQWESEWAM